MFDADTLVDPAPPEANGAVDPIPAPPAPPAAPVYPVADTADDLLTVDEVVTRTVPIPIWGRAVVIRALSMSEAERLFRDARVTDPDGRVRVDGTTANRLLVQRSLVQPKMTPGQVDALFAKSAAGVSQIVAALMEINGWGSGFNPNPF